MDSLRESIIARIVAFGAGEPARRLLPLSSIFVPEPEQWAYLVATGRWEKSWNDELGIFYPRVFVNNVRAMCKAFHFPSRSYWPRKAKAHNVPIEYRCTICHWEVDEPTWIPQVYLQTRLRLLTIPNNEAVLDFIERHHFIRTPNGKLWYKCSPMMWCEYCLKIFRCKGVVWYEPPDVEVDSDWSSLPESYMSSTFSDSCTESCTAE